MELVASVDARRTVGKLVETGRPQTGLAIRSANAEALVLSSAKFSELQHEPFVAAQKFCGNARRPRGLRRVRRPSRDVRSGRVSRRSLKRTPPAHAEAANMIERGLGRFSPRARTIRPSEYPRGAPPAGPRLAVPTAGTHDGKGPIVRLGEENDAAHDGKHAAGRAVPRVALKAAARLGRRHRAV